ncbi:MAG: YceH family protein [Acidimicrobiales bacterium]
MELDPVQIRVLGCLIEKESTTPDGYPLSTNALLNACNQSSNRDPVVAFDERTVTAAMLELRAEGLARTVRGGRTDKHKHVLEEAWSLTPAELAVLAVLFLRGPQTVGELRTRTERMHPFDDLDEIEATLAGLAGGDRPFVARAERRPGQKESRWYHLLVDPHTAAPTPPFPPTMAPPAPGVAAPNAASPGVTSPSGAVTRTGTDPTAVPVRSTDADLDVLRNEVERLRRDVDRLYELLGERPPGT